MKYQYCEFDTHEKEMRCLFYEMGKHDKYGCSCKFMEADRCYSMDRLTKEEKNDIPRDHKRME